MEGREQVDINVVVPESNELQLVPPDIQLSDTQIGTGNQPGRLAFTGLEVTAILLLAVILVASGVVVRRLARREPARN